MGEVFCHQQAQIFTVLNLHMTLLFANANPPKIKVSTIERDSNAEGNSE